MLVISEAQMDAFRRACERTFAERLVGRIRIVAPAVLAEWPDARVTEVAAGIVGDALKAGMRDPGDIADKVLRHFDAEFGSTAQRFSLDDS